MGTGLNPVSHDDLHRLETRVGGRIDSERAERHQAISDVRREVMVTVQAMHAENKSATADFRAETRNGFNEIGEKVDQLLEFRGFTQGAATASSVVGRFGGWIISSILAGLTVYMAMHK